ncbi:MAG: TrkH family potassium uptake protein [Gemmiger sp.]
MEHSNRRTHRVTASQIIALGFLAIILLGALLLSLPIATRDGTRTPFLNALFTATSATCVTGLVVYDTYSHWSAFGQAVILGLIQIGGLGFVTIALLINIFRRKKIGLRQRFLMRESLGLPQLGGILRATGFIVRWTATFEAAGAVLLATQFIPHFGFWRGIWYGVFHSISAFCNAGFDLMGIEAPFSSMTGWVDNPVVNLTLIFLIVVGGLGFVVWLDLYQRRFLWRRYRLQTKLVLTTTAVLLVLPFLFFYLVELRLPAWEALSEWERFWGAAFHTVTPRTAGFNTLDYGLYSEPGLLLTILLMLIGGAPGSTAGGLKLTTAAAVFLSVWSALHKKRDVEAFGRRLEDNVLTRVSVLVSVYLLLVLGGSCIISLTDSVPLMAALFESASAVATVGLSLGLTPSLSATSHLILIFLMYLGRVGGLTLLYALADPNEATPGRLPQEHITIG